jgi:hypothetical protein
MPKNKDTADFKVLVALGVIGFGLLIFGPAAYLAWKALTFGPPAETVVEETLSDAPVGALGELGSTCGGPDRLPCRPGLTCSTNTDFSKTGVCQKDEQASSAPGIAFRQLNETCAPPDFCAPGLFCSGADPSGVCLASDASSPNILKLKIDGAEPVEGGYAAAVGDKLKLQVGTINTEEIEAYFLPTDPLGERIKISFVKEAAGDYSSIDSLEAKPLMDGQFMVKVMQGKAYAALSLPFATIR